MSQWKRRRSCGPSSSVPHRQVRAEAGEEPTAEAEKLLVADIKQVWGKYQEKGRLKTSVEGISAEDIGRAQEMLEQDALQQMKKPQLIFENDRNVKNKASQIVSVSTQIPQMVPVGQNVQIGVENGINDQQLTDYTGSDIKSSISIHANTDKELFLQKQLNY